MSKAIRTGTIYRMVGILAMAVIGMAIVIPKGAQSMIKDADAQDAVVANRPKVKDVAVAPAKPVQPQAPVEFGAPTMAADPVDYAALQRKQADKPPVASPSNPTPQYSAQPVQATQQPVEPVRQYTHGAVIANPPPPAELNSRPLSGPKVGTVRGTPKYRSTGPSTPRTNGPIFKI